jgi:uncharacterized protein YegP (UPF0339 family)
MNHGKGGNECFKCLKPSQEILFPAEGFCVFCCMIFSKGKTAFPLPVNQMMKKEGIMSAKYEIKQAKDGKYFFNLKATNGQVILTSQMYKDKSGAKNGINSVQANANINDLFERKESSADKNFFVMKAKNHQVIGKSQFYASASSMENGIESVMKNGPTTEIDDLC